MKKKLIVTLAVLAAIACLFSSALAVKQLALPAYLRQIGDSAFEGDKSLDVVYVPDGCLKIGQRAFANSSVTDVFLPSSLTSIHYTAFDGCKNVLVHADKDSYAGRWCRQYGVPYADSSVQARFSNLVQDPRFYMPNFSFGDAEYREEYHRTSLRIAGKTSDLDILYSYIDMLCDGSHNFTLNYEYSFLEKYRSWSLTYTGTASVGEPLDQQYDDNYHGEMILYASNDDYGGTEFSGYIDITEGLEFADLGLRADGSSVVIEPIGESRNAAIIQSGNTYSTSDGRFSVTPGKAQLYLDGAKYGTSDVSQTRLEGGGQDQFLIDGYKSHDCLGLSLPTVKLDAGAEFTSKDLGMPQSANITTQSKKDFFNYFWQYALGACHSGNYSLLRYPAMNEFEEGYARVKLWDERADIGVVYLAARFSTAPYEVECLFAVRPSMASDGDDTKEYYTINRGASISLTANGGAYEEFNKSWSWEIRSGSGVVSLSSTIGQGITVKGLAAGSATVRVTYDCNYYYDDVLTGIQRTGRKATTQDYVITVQ